MENLTFLVDNDGSLSWMAPSHAPDLTDEQARTIAMVSLSRSMERLAMAIETFCERKSADIVA
jgi:hypothetical protein